MGQTLKGGKVPYHFTTSWSRGRNSRWSFSPMMTMIFKGDQNVVHRLLTQSNDIWVALCVQTRKKSQPFLRLSFPKKKTQPQTLVVDSAFFLQHYRVLIAARGFKAKIESQGAALKIAFFQSSFHVNCGEELHFDDEILILRAVDMIAFNSLSRTKSQKCHWNQKFFKSTQR